MYQYSPETQQQSAVSVFQNEDPPVKFTKPRSATKQLATCFFAKSGHVATILHEDKKTITADWYVNEFQNRVFQAWLEGRPKTGARSLFLHHDNASDHTRSSTMGSLAQNNIQIVTNPSYFEGLVPCDFFLIPLVKRQLEVK